MASLFNRSFASALFAAAWLSLAGCAASPPLSSPPSKSIVHDNGLARLKENTANTFRLDATQQPRSGHGSGIVISTDGHILTAGHVAENPDLSIRVQEENGTVIALPTTVVAIDPVNDLAVLKINRRFSKPVIMGNIRDVWPGDEVYSVGYPFYFGEMVTRGHVMRLRYSDENTPMDERAKKPVNERWILADFTGGPGGSGSGIFLSANGHLAGVYSMIINRQHGPISMKVNALVPVDQVTDFLRQHRIPYVQADGSTATYPPLPPAPPTPPTPPAAKQ